MPRRSVRLETAGADGFTEGVRAIEAQMGLADEFPAEVLAAAESPRPPTRDFRTWTAPTSRW